MKANDVRRWVTGFALGWIAASPFSGGKVETYEIVIAVVALTIAVGIDSWQALR